MLSLELYALCLALNSLTNIGDVGVVALLWAFMLFLPENGPRDGVGEEEREVLRYLVDF